MSDRGVYARLLDGAGLPTEVAGAKGAALDRLIGLGVPVPPSAVLVADAFRAFTDDPSLRSLLDSLRVAPIPAPDRHAAARREVDEWFLATPMAPALADAIAEIAGSIGGTNRLAIRSSATAEDLDAASFAGQYRSFLDVEQNDAARAVRLTWASLWHPAPRAYRRFHGIGEDDLAMSVIVMRMLDPQLAGVAFTRDPGGTPDAMRIELVHGLGEALVSGAATPDAFVVARAGGYAALAAVSPALGELPAMALHIEHEFGAAQDLEWAVDGDVLWILQARPITVGSGGGTDDGFDAPASSDASLTTAGIAEMLPGVVPPRLWELDSWLVEEGFRRLFDQLGGDIQGLTAPHALIARYRGRAALNLDNLRAAVASIPGGSPEELERQYFGDDAARGSVSTASSGGVAQGMRTLRARADAAQESEIVVRTVELLLDDEPDLPRLSDAALLALAARIRHIAARTVAAEIAIAAMAASSYRGVEALLARHLDRNGGESPAAIAQRITGRHGEPRTALAKAFDALVSEVRADARLMTIVSGADDPATLAGSPEGAAILARFHTAIRHAGSMAIFAAPTWEEAPDLAWKTFRAFLERPSTIRIADAQRKEARTDVEQRLHDDRGWRAARAFSGQLFDVRRAFLRREADDASELLDRRERTKAAVLMLGGIARRIDCELAARLTSRGRLEREADIEVLPAADTVALLAGAGPTPATIATRRRRMVAASIDGPLPHRFHGDPPPARRPVTGTLFHGWAASSGRYEGVARVVDSVASAQIRRGDVLVARTTDASWAPLFLIAGAIVVEEGGPLSHAAIVARELGVPAVLNVPGIMDRLSREADEVTITVDGSTGEVAIHRPTAHPASGIVPTREPPASLAMPSGALCVFVTGLIGASAFLSVVIATTEAISSKPGRARLCRRAEPIALMSAAGVREGFEMVAGGPIGLRPRRWFAVVAAVLGLASVGFATRSMVAFWEAEPSATGPVVAWAAALSSSLTLALGAVALGTAARRWPAVPLVVRRMVPRRTPAASALTAELGDRKVRLLAVLLGAVALLATLVTLKVAWLQHLDEDLYTRLDARATQDRWAPDWMNLLGQPRVVIPLAVVIALLAMRCRAIASAIPVSIVAAGVFVLAMTWLTARERPALGGHAGEHNSFPGGHVAQLTLLFGVLPLVVHVVTGRRTVMLVGRLVSTAVLAVLLADTVRTGGHWPSDQLAGFFIGLSLLIVIHARYSTTARHEHCHHRSVVAYRQDRR